jgi:hypothetical protein
VVFVFKDRAGAPMRPHKQVVLWTWPLLTDAIVWARFGTTWGLLEGIAVYGWWLTMIFGRAGAASWLRRHLITSFVLLVFVFATLFFELAALWLGTLLSVWWCWALGLFAGVIVTALLWPVQRRFWATLDK